MRVSAPLGAVCQPINNPYKPLMDEGVAGV